MGIWRASAKQTMATGMLRESTVRMAWRSRPRARSGSPAPTLRAIMEVKPTPRDMMAPLISILGEELMATEAVAILPREPTMAVSTVCTREDSTCSTKMGQASSRIVCQGLRLSSINEMVFLLKRKRLLLPPGRHGGKYSQSIYHNRKTPPCPYPPTVV